MNHAPSSSSSKLLRGARLRGVLILACVALLSGLPAVAAQRTTNPPQTRATSAPLPAPVKAYGSKSAPITMEVFSDYQCPHCRAFYEETLRQLIPSYVASGKVYLVHRDYPLPGFKYSGEAARWANACAEVGQFEGAEAALYENQNAWGADGNIRKFIAAAMPSSDFKRVEALLKDSAMPAPQANGASDPLAGIGRPCPIDPYIAQDIKLGYQVPVTGTPTSVVTYKGRRFTVPAVSWPILKQFFDSLLRQ